MSETRPESRGPGGLAIERIDGGYRVSDPRLGVSAEAQTADAACDALDRARDEILARCRELGVPIEAVGRSGDAAATRSLLRPGLALVVGVVLGMALQLAAERISNVTRAVGVLTDAREAGRRVAELVAVLGAAAETMPPEREEQLREDVRRIVRRATPIVRELAPLMSSVLATADLREPVARELDPPLSAGARDGDAGAGDRGGQVPDVTAPSEPDVASGRR